MFTSIVVQQRRKLLLIAVIIAALVPLLFSNHTVIRADNPPVEIEDGETILQRQMYWNQRRGELTFADVQAARQYVAANIPTNMSLPAPLGAITSSGAAPRTPTAPSGTWQLIGPQPILNGSTKYSGRVPAMAIDKTTSGSSTVIYLGAANGGVWKSTNNGTTWTPTMDTQQTMAVGAIAIDPNNNQIIYAGMGEANQSADSYYGSGVMKSTNGGSTWTLNGTSFFGTRNATISRLKVNPLNSNQLFASSSKGFVVSNDAGVTWAAVAGGLPGGSYTADDFALDSSTNPVTLYVSARSYGMYKSTNGGTSWTQLTTGLPSSSVFGNRSRLVIAPSNASVLYLVIVNGSGQSYSAVYNGGYYTTDGGASWSSLAAMNANFSGSQGWYDLQLAVDPLNDNILYAGGIDVFVTDNARGTSGTGNWRNISNVYSAANSGMHPDQHALEFGACSVSPCRLYVGNDGGAWYSDNPTGTSSGVTYTNLNNGLAISEYTGGDISPNFTTSAVALGGTQDNGTILYSGSLQHTNRLGGDGGFALINWTTPGTMYASQQNGYFYRSTNSGTSFSFITQVSGLFYAPITMDRTTPTHLAIGGTYVYETQNGGTNWYTGSSYLGTYVSTIAIAPSNSAIIYAGSYNGSIFKATNANSGGVATYTSVSTGIGSNQWVNQIWIDPSDPNIAYAATGIFYRNNGGYLYKTTNGGTNWTSISGNLPNLPVQSIIAYESNIGRVLLVGTDIGVFYSTNEGTAWTALNSGLPNTAVNQLAIDPAQTTILAYTHGRSVWKLALNQYVIATNTPTATNTATSTLTPSKTNTPTATKTNTATATKTNTPTLTPSNTATKTPTATLTLSKTNTPTATLTPVPRPDTIGTYKNGVFALRNSNSAGAPDIVAAFGGDASDLPVAGDWNGDGVDTIGVYRSSTGVYFLSNSNTSPSVAYSLVFGNPGDTPFAGHWTNDMVGDGVGVYRPSNGILYEKKLLTTGFSDYFAIFGNPGDQGVGGDWDGNGFDSIGVYRPTGTMWYLTNNSTPSGITYSDINFVWTIGSNYAVVGDWDGNQSSTVGYYTTTGVFVLHATNAASGSDNTFAYGSAGSRPIAGKWIAGAVPPASGILQLGGTKVYATDDNPGFE